MYLCSRGSGLSARLTHLSLVCLVFLAPHPLSTARDIREVYGLELPLALRGLLDGVLHPVPDRRFSLEEAFDWMDSHPGVF